MKAIEEMVIVAVPVSRACMGWERFQNLLVYLSGTDASRPAAVNQSSGEGAGAHLEGTAPQASDQCIAWFRLFDVNSHAGAVVFSPLDPGNTRVLARFAWPASALAPDIGGVEILADLLRFKDFVESLPADSSATDRAEGRL